MKLSRSWLFSACLMLGGVPVIAADQVEPAKAFATPTEAINHYIRDGYTKAKIASPSAKATDHEFLRRAYIDLIGRVATVEEVLDYERDSSGSRRVKLIQRLLNEKAYKPRVNGQIAKNDGKDIVFDYTDEHAQHWADLWTIWLMTRSGHPIYREQMRAWLENEFIKGTNHRDLTTKILTAKGRSNQNGAVNFIIHHLGESNAADKRDEVGPFDAIPITSRVTRLFLGIQTNCTQCHDHPFNKEWVQADFWGVNAYFRQTLRDRTPTGGADRRAMESPIQVELLDDAKYNEPQIIFYERRDGKLMASKPNFLKDLSTAESGETNHKPLPKGEPKSRRDVLSDYVTTHDNFAKAYVNRLWGHFFGRGLNKEPSIDDFGSHNEVVHPELLDYLAKEFAKYNYDPKKLMEWICTSEVYSLSHVANPSYIDPKYDAYFARMPLKALAPEVLYGSLITATNINFESGDKEARGRNRKTFEAKLVQNFGDDEGNEMTFNGTVVQALLMMNGSELNNEIARKTASNPVNRIIARHSKGGVIASSAVIDELFLAALNRRPTSTESAKINAIMNRGAQIAGEAPAGKTATPVAAPVPAKPLVNAKGLPIKGKDRDGQKKNAPVAPVNSGPRAVPASSPNDATFYQDLFWALLNTNEFMLNH